MTLDATAIAPRILLLDDDPFMVQLLQRMLERLGIVAVGHDDGYRALQELDAGDGAPDLILLDLNMPQMDGIEFIRHLVACDYRGSLILLSGAGERVLQSAESLVHAQRIPLLGSLLKPVGADALAALLARWRPPAAPAEAAPMRRLSASELDQALASGQLGCHYQPQVEVASRRLVGFEALARWQHPRHGLLYPDSFIAMAEQQGRIDALARQVIRSALVDAGRWGEHGQSWQLSVNLSMANLLDVELVEWIEQAVADAGLANQQLTLEVTESQLLQDLRAPLEVLTRLRMKHFRLSIDDFGTGHSSLAQLRDIPFDELKLDRGFVHGAHNNPTRRAIFDASRALAARLGMGVVAEGVEDADDWALLQAAGCELAQGYLIARPMAADRLLDWAQAWSRQERWP